MLNDVPIYARSLIMVVYPINLPASGEIPMVLSAKDDHPFFREGTSSFVAPVMHGQPSPMDRAQSASVSHRPIGELSLSVMGRTCMIK